jgi:very-short-patch-repair endonuclease
LRRGAHHARPKQQKKDAAINANLEAVGIRPVRVTGREINFDLPTALSRVTEALTVAA